MRHVVPSRVPSDMKGLMEAKGLERVDTSRPLRTSPVYFGARDEGRRNVSTPGARQRVPRGLCHRRRPCGPFRPPPQAN